MPPTCARVSSSCVRFPTWSSVYVYRLITLVPSWFKTSAYVSYPVQAWNVHDATTFFGNAVLGGFAVLDRVTRLGPPEYPCSLKRSHRIVLDDDALTQVRVV